ncbi:UDP-glycosyltransferase 74G1-like [Camellia sinensis]|uniref:Glycosyltransferase n=1 Tax=Camellia sinensis var. sinensis TaxID=542762 RepID=A0A4S4DWR1_CAMSN|nr:UDP-glycosyltransferase 74G1-like [Camellia sinensis]THG07812.1 hypothetical protein TEA_014443 [Camellia sinensis var. sinensis]URP23410.1 glycosyltransferase [Camellia sinensis]
METPNRAYKAHVLVLPYPAQGHINPMLQFSKRLVARGVKATLANSVYISKSMHKDQISTIDTDTFSDGHDDGGYDNAENPEAYLTKLRDVGSRTLASLIEKLNGLGRPVDALIYDGFLPWALDVAKELGILGVVFFTQTCAVNSIYYHVHEGLLSLPLSPDSTILLPGLPPLESCETPSFVYAYGLHPSFYDLLVNQFSNVDKADWVLFNTFYELEKEVVDWMSKLWRVRTIGPTLPSMYLDQKLKDDIDYGINLFKPHSTVCMNWLNAKPSGSVVYVSFGSMAQFEPEQMEEIAWGLNQSNYNFLWVVRATEEAKLPNNFINDTAEKGLVVTWSPQLEVLAHESIGCFVTHCGFNSVLEALSLGVPMVGVPYWSDQATNAKFVEDVWGIGIRAKMDDKGIVRREVLEACMKEVFEGKKKNEVKMNAMKWKKLAKEALGDGGSSDKNIDEFVAELVRS